MACGEELRHLGPADIGQYHGREQQIEPCIALCAQVDAGCSIFCFKDPITMRPERIADQFAKRTLVLDEENGLRASDAAVDPGCRRGSSSASLRPGEIDLEFRALSRFAAHGDESAALSDDAIDGGQAQPRAFTGFLRRIEGLKYA